MYLTVFFPSNFKKRKIWNTSLITTLGITIPTWVCNAVPDSRRLYISQLRLPAFCSSEGLFGLFDGGGEGALPAALVKAVPRILLEERAVTETAADYLKYTLLSAHR